MAFRIPVGGKVNSYRDGTCSRCSGTFAKGDVITRAGYKQWLCQACAEAEGSLVKVQVQTQVEVEVQPKPEPEAPNFEFVTPSWYPILKYAMESEKGCCLFGPRGCGKSTAIRHLAREVGATTELLQCAANMQIDSLLGSWTSEGGSLKFIDGPLTIAVRNGSWLLAEEANVIHPGVWSMVNTLTDQTGEGLRLPTGEVIKPSKSFRLILLYNEGYTGTRDVNAALKDRLMPIYTGYLPVEDEVKLLERMTGATNEECGRVQGAADMIRKADLHFDLSPRSLSRWIRLVKQAGFTWKRAYEIAIMDLLGTPETAAPQRAVLNEIAANTVDQWQVS